MFYQWEVANAQTSLEDLEKHLIRTPLYSPPGNRPKEKWAGGSLRSELELWNELGLKVAGLQNGFSKKLEIPKGRLFHAKSHGCLRATLKLNPARPDWTRRGIYSSLNFSDGPEEYQAIVRFSNGLADTRSPDRKPDLRGLAVKLFIPGGFQDPFSGSKNYVMDMTAVNTPWPMTKDPSKFMEFAEVNLNPFELVYLPSKILPRPRVWVWAMENKDAVSRIYRGTIKNDVGSLTKERWWSQHAYLHGEGEDAKAIKYNFRPSHTDRFYSPVQDATLLKTMTRKVVSVIQDSLKHGPLDDKTRDNLRTDLEEKAGGGFRFILSLQKEVDSESTPLENTPFEWTEQISPSVPVAQLEVRTQSLTSEKDKLCEEILFSPGHFHPAHRPLEEMGRFRVFAYLIGHQGRKGHDLPQSPEKIQTILDQMGR